jgi:protease IV
MLYFYSLFKHVIKDVIILDLIQFICNQKLAVEEDWGLAFLQEVLLKREMFGQDINSYYKEDFQKSLQVAYYTENGFIGNDLENQDIRSNSVAVVSLSGLMTSSDGICHKGMRSMDAEMKALYSNKKITGIVIDAETGGGQATAGDVLYNTIKDKNKPVGIYTTLLASAGIKGTLKADFITAASESTIVGSIGTMIMLSKKDIQKSSDDYIELYSTSSPNKNRTYREVKLCNYEPLIAEITKIDNIFMDLVKSHRPLRGSKAVIDETLSGATFPGIEAKDRGLIDSIGTMSTAIDLIFKNTKYYRK